MLLAHVYLPLEDQWMQNLADVRICSSGGLHLGLVADHTPVMLQQLQRLSWVPTWLGLKQPGHASARVSKVADGMPGQERAVQLVDIFQQTACGTYMAVKAS